MANIYQIRIASYEATGIGTINADTFVQRRVSTNPDVWVDTTNGHRTIVLQASEVTAITQSAMSIVEKRDAIRNLIRAKVAEYPIDAADQAEGDIASTFAGTGGIQPFPYKP